MKLNVCSTTKSYVHAGAIVYYPCRSPVGPMEVPNMRLNSAGSLMSLLVPGNFAPYSFSFAVNAGWS